MRLLLVVIAVCIAGAAAQSFSNCDPIDPSRCMLPFPNNFWLRLNASTGKRNLQFDKTFPQSRAGHYVNEQKGGWNDLDGFSALMPIITSFGNVKLDALPHNWNVSRSLDADCPSILLDTVTGKLVPHWIELDISAGAGVEIDKMLVMWPAQRLQDERRYIVAYRGLVNASGPVATSASWRALRDNINTTNPDVELRRAIYADMFSRLHDVGVQRDSSLNLVWDFTTNSRAAITNRMVYIRDDAFKRVGSNIQYKITAVKDNVNENVIRSVQGVVHVPSYVTSHLPGAHFVIDPATDMPVYQNMYQATFTILIPKCLPGNGTIGSILQYGHGLFGGQDEVNSGYLGQQANQHGYVLAAVDWIGLATLDAVSVAAMMSTDFTEFRMVPDRSQQGMLNALFMMRLMKSAAFQKDAAMTFNGKPVLDQTSGAYYYGNSQGGILGTMYMAVTQDVQRGVVGVTGAPYSLLLPRSHDFENLFLIIGYRYPNTLDRFCMFAMMQLLWDRADPGGYLHAVTSNPLPNTPAHEIVIHHALGDAQVTYQGAYALGRSIGASMFASNVHEPNEELFGYPFIADTATGKTAVQVTWQFAGTPPAPQTDVPPSKATDTHEKPRRTKASQDQMYRFFTTGDIINYCGGACH